MRILIVSQWFQPEPFFKGLNFAKALRDLGHEVEVLTGFPNYPGGVVYPGYRVRPVQREILEGIVVTRGYLYPNHDRSAWRRVVNYLSFAVSSSILALGLRKPDVVYVYTPPMTAALSAVALRIFKRVPFVADIQDLWPDTLAATGMLDNKHLLRAVGWFVDFTLRRASGIIVLSPGFARILQERGIKSPITVIPNWAPPEIVSVADALANQGSGGRSSSEPFNVLFAGNLGKAQNLETALKAARLLEDDSIPAAFTFAGGGVESQHLQKVAADMGLNSVRFLPSRHPSEMGELFEAADALLVHLVDDPLFRITIPSKTQAYMVVAKPILLGVEGDAADMVKDAGAGLTFKSGSAEEMADAIKQIMAMSPADRAMMGRSGKDYYNRELAFQVGINKVEKVLVNAASSSRTMTGNTASLRDSTR